MTSRQLPFQVTFGEDGRLQMDNIEENNACGYSKTLEILKCLVTQMLLVDMFAGSSRTHDGINWGQYDYNVDDVTVTSHVYKAATKPGLPAGTIC